MTTRTRAKSIAAEEAGNQGFSLISNEKLLQLYSLMVKCRMIEERAHILLEQSKSAGKDRDAWGLEATAVGVAIDLLPKDTIFPAHRWITMNFIKGAPLESLFRSLLLRGPIPNLAARLKLAARAAMVNKTERNGKIAVAFLSGVSNSPRVWREALTKASAQRLPILFVGRTSLPVEQQETRTEEIGLEERPRGLPSITVDGNDVVAVYRVATEAIAHARRGNGPTLIEFRIEGRMADESIQKMEKYLARKGLFSKGMKLVVLARFTRELDAAIVAAQAPLFLGHLKPARMVSSR